MLISLIWTHKTFLNISHMAACHVIGTWYFSPEEAAEGCFCCRPVTCQGLKRACVNYLGSIAFGSLVVAILEALYYTCKYYTCMYYYYTCKYCTCMCSGDS